MPRSSDTPHRGPRREVGFLGLDPGKAGGAAILNAAGKVLLYVPMGESVLDIWLSIFERKLKYPYLELDFTVLEFVSYFPSMGGVSAFTFGGNYYALQMALVAQGLPHSIIRPAEWQSFFKLPKRGGNTNKHRTTHKEVLRKAAQRMFPKCELWRELIGVQRKCCDALLIAEYARRTYLGKDK